MAMDTSQVRQQHVNFSRLVHDYGIIGISAFKAKGAIACAADSAVLSNAEPIPFPLGASVLFRVFNTRSLASSSCRALILSP